MVNHVVVTLITAFLLASVSVWVVPKYASSHLFLTARSPDHLSAKQIEELVHEFQGMRETVSMLKKENMELKEEIGETKIELHGEIGKLMKRDDIFDEKLDKQDDELDALVRAAKASISPRNASSVNSTEAAIVSRMWPSMQVGGRRLNGRTPAIYATADFFSLHSVPTDKWASLPGYVQNNFWATTMATLVEDTTLRANAISIDGVAGVSGFERALVGLGIGLVSMSTMVNPALAVVATFAYSMFNTHRSSGDLAGQINGALNTLYHRIIEETRAYTDAAIKLERLNTAQDANREAIAAVMDELLWVPDMLDQAAGQENAEHKQTRVMYQFVLQHDLAKLSASVFGPCIYDADSADCREWQERGTFIQAIVFATIHVQVLNDIAITDTRYMPLIGARLKEVSTRYHHLLKPSVEAMDRRVRCLIGVSQSCGLPTGQSVAGLPGLWFHAPQDRMTCNEVCSLHPNMEFDAASSQHSSNQATEHFNPGADRDSYDRTKCLSIATTAGHRFNFPPDGSPPDGNCRPVGRACCACKYTTTSDPKLLIKFHPMISSFNIGTCVAPIDGIILNARDSASGGPCAEGAAFDTAGGSATCTARCKPGFTPSVQSVPCTSGYPDVLFTCAPDLSYTTFGNGPCRGTSPTDNPKPHEGGWYYLWSHLKSAPGDVQASHAECKARCDQNAACVAIEVRQDGKQNRCEIWLKEPLAYAGSGAYTCLKKDVLTPHFPAATAGPSEARCAAEGGTPAIQEGCRFACNNQQVAGATRYSVGSWSHSPGCFVVVDGQYKGACHWNTNTGNIGYDNKVRPVCTKSAHKTMANCVDTSNGATAVGGYWGAVQGCEYYSENPTHCVGSFYYEDEDFSPDDMCCACGGGFNPDFGVR